MPKVTNLGKGDLTLPSGHLLPAGKAVEIDQTVLDIVDNRNVLRGRLAAKTIEIAGTAATVAAPAKTATPETSGTEKKG
ncbi:hypothetical protein EOW65_15090 [Sinirhodobacter ferrireducens]|uniref:Uncharacterized protein n=1 Tax=Paenirhodobacter ferrireducens TaxID=1215032 RepID=A0A443L9N9_9RHOB|nr:hypothetical protein [Sinirhodobacter ferrireducens]RWR45868.1 hypothetical protein EOW65_15090 [Sinirhodobacter ferrireducens]